jgi:hypothetical protein
MWAWSTERDPGGIGLGAWGAGGGSAWALLTLHAPVGRMERTACRSDTILLEGLDRCYQQISDS